LNEIIQSWSRRKCFSKRWLEDASSKFTAPKGANSERDEGKGWYALMADNLKKAQGQNSLLPPGEDGQAANGEAGGAEGDEGKDGNHKANKKRGIVQDEEDDETVNKAVEESRKRRAALMAKYKDD